MNRLVDMISVDSASRTVATGDTTLGGKAIVIGGRPNRSIAAKGGGQRSWKGDFTSFGNAATGTARIGATGNSDLEVSTARQPH